MKQIQPVTIWANGVQQQANFLNAYIVHDNLATSATFYYELVKQVVVDDQPQNTPLTNGNQTVDGEDYINWNQSPDVNEEAYVILAQKLNLTLV